MIRTQQIPAASAGALARAATPIDALVEQMADKMCEMALNGTAVTADSLFAHSDFTRAEIDEHGPEAADLARSRAVRRVS